MSIADQITELTTIRGDIRTALGDKGVTATDHNFADFAADIAAIPSGGSSRVYTVNLTPDITFELGGES